MVTEGYWLLLLIMILGLISDNALIAGAALMLLLIKAGGMDALFTWIMRYGIALGLFLLIVTILVPVADEHLSLGRLVNGLLSPAGLAAVAISAVSTYLAKHGVDYLRDSPEVLVGLVTGSVLGTVAFGGVPTGPLIAAGATALLIRWLK